MTHYPPPLCPHGLLHGECEVCNPDERQASDGLDVQMEAVWLAFRRWMQAPPTGPLSAADEDFIAAMYSIMGMEGEPQATDDEDGRWYGALAAAPSEPTPEP